MPKSTTSRRRIKDTKPAKPYDGFPLFAHASGRWAKKIRQRIEFFGRWGRKQGDRIMPVDDVPASAATALEEFNRQWPYLSQGRTPPPINTGSGCTVRDLCNSFLTAKQNRLDVGELSLHSFAQYHRTCARLVEFFGKHRRIDDLRPDDFEQFRTVLAKGCGVVTLKNNINCCRVILKHASDNRLIDRPVEYGSAFNRPSAKAVRTARNAAGERMFDVAELRSILEAADPVMKTMVLLGVNCGFGNTDVASLPQSAVDLNRGWIEFPRPKTAIQRRVPLWKETVAALRAAVAQRPEPKDHRDAGLVFLTTYGTRFVRVQGSQTAAGTHVMVNGVSRRFESLLNRLKIKRRGLGFYTLRHVFETIARDSQDQVAVDAIMGHVASSMAGMYRERIADERLQAVVKHVRKWLFPPAAAKARMDVNRNANVGEDGHGVGAFQTRRAFAGRLEMAAHDGEPRTNADARHP